MEDAAPAMPAPDAGDAALLGFTDAAPAHDMAAAPVMPMPAANDAAAVDPMSLIGEQPTSPGLSGGGLSPPAPAVPAGYVDPFQGMPVKDSPAMGGGSMSIPEMNALREWEDKHERELEEDARKEEAEKKEKKKAAEAELAKWHEERNAATQKRISTNRADEKSSEAARTEAQKPGANPWERVVDLIDTNARTADEARDTSRMRSLLIQLKSNPITAAA